MQELQYVELFAGQANVWRAVSTKYAAARIDLDYSADFQFNRDNRVPREHIHQNSMDILTDAGLGLPSSKGMGL